VTTILHDVNEKVSTYTTEARQEIYNCAEAFSANQCAGYRDLGRVAPALYGMCESWETCMNRDPKKVGGRAKVGAETMAEVVNGFVDVISWKTMVCPLIYLVLSIAS